MMEGRGFLDMALHVIIPKSSTVGAGDAGDAAASPSKIFWARLIRFGRN